MDLFDLTNQSEKLAPLAERMRPTSLDDFLGQGHIVGADLLLRRAIKADMLGSCIFYGPPGCGKTTLANIIAFTTNANFVKLNAVTAGIADAKRVIDEAKEQLRVYGKKTYLLLDECHRWNKAQSDSVLQAIEQGTIIFIGSTTENPYSSMTRALVSRCRVFEFKKLSTEDVVQGLKNAIKNKQKGLGNMNIEIEPSALKHIALIANGDMRNALNSLELAALTAKPDSKGVVKITEEIAEQSCGKRSLGIDESAYYDMISAFIKSMRGSDSNAALYWCERLLAAGCDPMLIARRIVIQSAEDVGMADPLALVVATSAMTALQNVGLPEGKIPLAEAIVYVSEAPKSNRAYMAQHLADEAVNRIKNESVPIYLQDPNYKGEDKIGGYLYPHDFGGYVKQQYLPDELKDEVFYTPTENGFEKTVKERQEKRKKNET